LLQKGITKVALYGLGSMRDERLNRMWESKKVRFLRPEEDQHNNDKDDDDEDEEDSEESSGFFNIFTLHQNRDLGRGGKNCVQESMIPEWMDLVVWVRNNPNTYLKQNQQPLKSPHLTLHPSYYSRDMNTNA
jgi:double-strand break repair protein MRE11